MDKPTDIEIAKSIAGGKSNELTNIAVLHDEEQKEKQLQALSGIGVHEQATKSNESGNMQELSTIMTDVYSLSSDKFEHDLLHLIDTGHGLDNWHHQAYSHAETDSFPHTAHIESSSMPSCSMDIQSTSQASVTLAVLNSTNADEAAHSVPYSFTQSVKHSSSLDHDYLAFQNSKHNHLVIDSHQVDNNAHMQEQVELGMDEEKLLRMKRRKEKNRECSRQFRLKQKDKEQRLTLGKIEKSKTLDNMKRNVAKLKTILSKISQKCSGCPKASMLLNQHLLGGDKENINPNLAQDFLELCQ